MIRMLGIHPPLSWALAVCALSCIAGSARASVEVVDGKDAVTLRNEALAVTFEKASGRVTGLVYQGRPILMKGQSAVMSGLAGWVVGTARPRPGEEGDPRSQWTLEGSRVTITANTPELGEVSFARPRPKDFPFDIDVRFALRDKESGFYWYMTARKPADLPAAFCDQIRFAMRVDWAFRNVRVTDECKGVLPETSEFAEARSREVMNATYQLASGEIITKYVWSARTGDSPVYGLNDGHVGLWQISANGDFVNGGPTKQRNTCHATPEGPILLSHGRSNHYGSEGSHVLPGPWEKIYGPVFIYLNSGADSEALWRDAKAECARQRAAWPYQWVHNPLYPLERGVVKGRFQLPQAAPVKEGWVVLARPKEERGLDWQRQGSDTYISYARIEPDGAFAIPAVRAGQYSLYAFATGVPGEFRKDGVSVRASQTTDLGALDWKPRSLGRLLWRIGTPDRTAREFRHGDDFRHWGLWFDYEKDFPQDVDFTVGRSDERRDWNYAQMAIWREEGGWRSKIPQDQGEGEWRLPQWTVRFDCAKPVAGQATLTLAFAAVEQTGERPLAVIATLNGREIGKAEGLESDGALHRNGIQGRFQERLLPFDASLLQTGENVLRLGLKPGKITPRRNYPVAGVMYDFLSLEVKE